MIHRLTATRHYYIISVFFAVVFVLFFTPWQGGDGFDEIFYYGCLTSPLFDGDGDVTNDYFLSTNNLVVIRTELSLLNERGHLKNQFAAGSAVLWLPFVGTVRLAGLGLSALLPQAPAWVGDRYSAPYLWALSFGTLAYGLLAALLMYETCRMRFRPRASLHAALAAVFASPLVYYVFRVPAMAHAPSAFAASLLVYVTFRCRRFGSWKEYAAVGGACALCAIVRWQDATLALIPAAAWTVHASRAPANAWPRLALRAAVAVAAFALVASVQSFYWHGQTLRWFTMPQPAGYVRWLQPEFGKLLFGGWSGLFYWHPLLLIGAVGLAAGLLRARCKPFHAALLAALLTAIYVNACVSDWFSGVSFGSRRFCSVLPLFALGLAGLYHSLPHRLARFLPAWTALAVFANLVLMTGWSRGVFRPYYLAELTPVWRALAARLPAFLTTLPLDYGTVSERIWTGRLAGALALGTIGTGVILAVTGLWRSGKFRVVRTNPVTWMIPAALLSLSAALVFVRPLPPSSDGIRFSAVSPRNEGKPWPTFDTLARIGRTWRSNPVAWLWALDVSANDAQRLQALEGIRSVSERLWAMAVLSLPDGPLRRELASSALGREGESRRSTAVLLRDLAYAARSGGKQREERSILRRAVAYSPTDPEALQQFADAQRVAGWRNAALETERFRRSVLEARVSSFMARWPDLGEWKGIYFANYMADTVGILERLYWRQIQFEPLLGLYANLKSAGTISTRQVAGQRVAEALERGKIDSARSLLHESSDVYPETILDAAAAAIRLKKQDWAVGILAEGVRRFPDNGEIRSLANRAGAVQTTGTAALNGK